MAIYRFTVTLHPQEVADVQLSEQPSEQVLEMMHSSEQPVTTLPEIIVEIAKEISALTPVGQPLPNYLWSLRDRDRIHRKKSSLTPPLQF